MSIGYCKKTRRQFLMGTGKSMLLLPLLPSLLPKEAMAQAATADRKMMLFWFDHNNLSSLWPAKSIATTPLGSIGMRERLLSAIGTASTVSSVFSNSRYQSLVNRNQLSIIRGFDTAVAYGPGHGNFTLAAGAGRNSEGNHPTIDAVIEASRTVYPTSTPAFVRKALRVSTNGGDLFYQRVGSTIQGLPLYDGYGVINFYNEVFSSLTGGSVPVQDFSNQLKSNILNRVHASFTSFRANRRISSDDRARLAQHMDYVSDRQAAYQNISTPPVAQSCSRPTAPAQSVRTNPAQYTSLYLDLLALAFKCGLSKFGVMNFEAHDPRWIPSLNIDGLPMHDVMHGQYGNDLQIRSYRNWWTYHTNLIADRFISELDVQEGSTGRTYLDNMVTGMLCAGGIHTPGGDGGHSGLDSQQILLGSMGGRLRSGYYTAMPNAGRDQNMPYNCFLITLLNLMGVPSSEYSTSTPDGRGFGYYAAFGSNHPFASRYYQPLTELLT